MKKYIEGFDDNGLTISVLENETEEDIQWALEHGFFEAEVEEAWDGSLWKPGTAPYDPPVEYLDTQNRMKRDALLQESDVYMLMDYPISDEERELWMAYRHALRDLPEQDGWPADIQWPEPPEQPHHSQAS